MAVKAQGDVPDGMQRDLPALRCAGGSSHRGRLPTPAGLWASAAAVAREYGVFRTAKVLRLEYGKLKRMVELSGPGSAQTITATPATFLELMPSQAVASVGASLIELEGPRGKIRIQWKGAAALDPGRCKPAARCGGWRDSDHAADAHPGGD